MLLGARGAAAGRGAGRFFRGARVAVRATGAGAAPGDADELWMRQALEEARAAFTAGEVPVGAVVVGPRGDLLHRAHNAVERLRDPTAHAEMLCLRAAAEALGAWRLEGATLFVTLEPCPMCAGALLQARISRLVWGAPNRHLGADGSWVHLLGDRGDVEAGAGETSTVGAPQHPFHPELQVDRDVLAPECAALMRDFFRQRREGRIPAPGPGKPPPAGS